MTQQEKLLFLFEDFPKMVRAADPNKTPLWGKMNLQQMVEHMSDAVRNANAKLSYQLITPEERVPAMQAFIRSEKEFKPETKNALLGTDPEPLKNPDLQTALKEYEMEVEDMIIYFQNNPDAKLMNPFFGELNYSDWCDLLYKHALHHLKQFDLVK